MDGFAEERRRKREICWEMEEKRVKIEGKLLDGVE